MKAMIYTVFGKLTEKKENFLVLECGGIGFKILAGERMLGALPTLGGEVKVFCFLYVREDKLDLYGFLEEQSLKLFEMLNGVSGIGPKTALALMDLDSPENIMAAILEKKTELLTRTSGIGRKTAERVILELSGKIKMPQSEKMAKEMDMKMEAEEALVGLGYQRSVAKRVLEELGTNSQRVEEMVKEALKMIGRK